MRRIVPLILIALGQFVLMASSTVLLYFNYISGGLYLVIIGLSTLLAWVCFDVAWWNEGR